MILRTLTLISITITSWATMQTAAEDASGYSMDLLDGQSLDAWVVTGCEAEVQDGVLVLKAGNGLLRTHHRYTDFELELSWRAKNADKWDSGIFFRSEPPPPNQPWPDRYQINLRKGLEGELVDTPAKPPAGLVLDGQWNQFRLLVCGGTAELQINGQPAWKFDGLENDSGYVGLQAEVPGGGQFEFKDIRITEFGYCSLFNGSDLTGWEAASGDAAQCWQVEDGLLMCNGQRGTWLRTVDEYGDFNLRLEYKLRPGGNSGVYIRVPKSGSHHGENAGIEVQILDDAAERYRTLKPYQYTASLYAIMPADPRVARPPGEWNTLEIDCKDRTYRTIHNGIVVVSADAEGVPELQRRLVKGFLGLQNHKEEVWFRNLRIGPAQ